MINRTTYLSKIIPFIDDELIKVLIGMRRVGKSTMFELIIKELKSRGIGNSNIININFEIYSNQQYTKAEVLYEHLLSLMVNRKKYYIFLDEIQEVENFERVINSLSVEKNVDIYITGSNSRILSGELTTYLTGRYISFEIFPLSFKEIADSKEGLNRDDLFIEYIQSGGLPSLQRFDSLVQKKIYLNDIYNSILLKDIVKRYKIRDVDLLERLLSFMINNISQTFSSKNITKYLKSEKRSMSRETIYSYIKACQNAFLLYSAPRYDIKGKEILKTLEKFFINDQGIRSLMFNNESDIEQVLENIIYFELLRRGYDVFIGFLPDSEIDFVAKKDSEKIYIQVSYLLASENTINREFGAFKSIRDNYKKYVISMDKIDRSRDGIVHLNIIDFLLSEGL